MKCGECGSSITAEIHHKFYKRKGRHAEYIYYRCSKKKGSCNQKYLSGGILEDQIFENLKKVALPNSAAQKFKIWANEDAQEERKLSAGQIEILKVQLKEAEGKIDRLLEGYLDKIIDPVEYQKKKNELLQMKVTINEKIKEIERTGNNWLEPFLEFVETASEIEKIARAKKKDISLRNLVQSVGSNFFLTDRQLAVNFKSGGFDALVPPAGGTRSSQFFRSTLDWRNIVRDVGKILQRQTEYIYIPNLSPQN
ncbi:MAG: zinc ribbon domain-containing protein [Patescibacteria group bacterium]|nr:zinc ribbon domain-containing protein [Patescibacteria group bacterium]